LSFFGNRKRKLWTGMLAATTNVMIRAGYR